MNQKFVILFALIAAVSAAPYYTTSLVETPTSRFETRLILSPQVHETYKIRPQHIIPYQRLSFPDPELVYYHGQPQLNPQQYSMNLYGLQQNSPFWQKWYSQLVSETAEVVTEGSRVESSSEANFEYSTQRAEPSTETPTESRFGEDESNKMVLKEEVTTTETPAKIEAKPEIDDTVITNSADHHEHLTRTEDTDHFAAPLKAVEQSENYDSFTADDEKLNRQPLQAPFQQQIFTLNNRYFVVNGPPQFYENFDARAPVFSLQELQPITRTTDKAQAEKITETPMPSSTKEPSSTLRINVVDEDELEESTRDNDESEHLMPRSQQLPSSDENLEKESEMSEKEEKREQSDVEGRGLSDESSIAQAKPNAIAIAGEGGVASSKPIANAISGPSGLSVASPSATAVAGNFNFDGDEDRKQNKNPRRYETSK